MASSYERDSRTWLGYGLVLYFGFLQAVLGSVVPYLRRELHIGYTTASLHIAAFALGAVAGAIASRHVEARSSRRILVVVGAAGMGAAGLGIAASPSVVGTIASCALMGLSGNLLLVGTQAALSDMHGDGRGVALGEANVAGSLGALSMPLVLALGQATGLTWRLALAVGAAAGAALALRVWTGGLKEPDGSVLAGEAAGRLPSRARTALVLLFCVVCAEWCVSFWAATFADDEVGLSTNVAVALSSAFFGAMLLGRVVTSRVVRRRSAEFLVVAGLTVALAGFPLLWIADDVVTAGTALVLLGLGIGGLFPMALTLAFNAAPGLATLVSARAGIAGSTAVLLAPLALGQLADEAGLRAAFAVMPVFLLLAMTTMAVLVRQRVPDRLAA